MLRSVQYLSVYSCLPINLYRSRSSSNTRGETIKGTDNQTTAIGTIPMTTVFLLCACLVNDLDYNIEWSH